MSDVANTERAGFTFIWKIENFSLVTKLPPYEFVGSLTFTAENLDETSWYLRLESFEGYRNEDQKDKFVFNLYKSLIAGPNFIYLDYELSILSSPDTKVKSIAERGFLFHNGSYLGTSLCITPHEIFSRREILPGDTLTVQCKMWHHEKQCLEPGFSLARTRLGVERRSFTWSIDKFSSLKANDTKSVSMAFRPNLNLSFTIKLFLTGIPAYKEIIRMKVGGSNKEASDFVVMLGISVQNVNGKALYHSEDEFKLSGMKDAEWPFPLILDKKELASNKDLLLPKDVLSLKCVFAVSKFSAKESIILNEIERTTYGADAAADLERAITNTIETPCPGNEVHSSSNSLTNDLRHLLENNYLADISLRVLDKVFPAHKAILAARSSVFKTMFDTDMKEKITNIIEIDDFEPDTVRRLLLYMYSGTLESDVSWETASSLCLAAEKYSVVDLKEKCTSFLKQNLSSTNVCETLFLADILIDEDLKNAALTFVERNDKEVMNSNEWKHFAQKHPQLAVEILSRLYRRVKDF